MKFTSSDAIDQIINMIEQGLEEHSQWFKLWNSRAICHLPFPADYLREDSHTECDFAKWFQTHKFEEWIHQFDYDSILTAHKTMHDEARSLAKRIQEGYAIGEEDYYNFMNSEWNFFHQLQSLKDKITRLQISYDPLTAIFNRQAMMPILMQEYAYIVRDRKQCCVAMADLDHFKMVNDTFGHANGDKVLKKVASFFRTNLRPYDALFRYGGEEFLFCLPNTDVESATKLLDRLRMELEKLPIALGDEKFTKITVSIGITQMSPEASIEQSIENADKALYDAKGRGRNQIQIWEETSSV